MKGWSLTYMYNSSPTLIHTRFCRPQQPVSCYCNQFLPSKANTHFLLQTLR